MWQFSLSLLHYSYHKQWYLLNEDWEWDWYRATHALCKAQYQASSVTVGWLQDEDHNLNSVWVLFPSVHACSQKEFLKPWSFLKSSTPPPFPLTTSDKLTISSSLLYSKISLDLYTRPVHLLTASHKPQVRHQAIYKGTSYMHSVPIDEDDQDQSEHVIPPRPETFRNTTVHSPGNKAKYHRLGNK